MSGHHYWRRSAHVPVLITLQIVFIILFAIFVVYNPENAVHGKGTNQKAKDLMKDYPLFQDVHVMIFIGFGFLMTFLKKYGLSAVSLNMLCAVLSLQWATLVIGFFHLHYPHPEHHDEGHHADNHTDADGIHADALAEPEGEESQGLGVIYLDLYDSMLLSDFASASVLISFGAVIGTTTPLQLIVMTILEIVVFAVNEVIGRKYLHAVDAGDSIFVHAFGAYFGLAVSRMLYTKNSESQNQGSGYTSDLFSMVGTVFLWMFWPSFNGAAAVYGEPQHRAVLNTYFSLCASVIAAFSFSALLNHENKFVMEHIQNATLAGGVAIGAVADLLVQPFGALIIGSVAGTVSVVGYDYFTPWIKKKLKVHDTCGVHNLHGIPALIATVLSIIMAGTATESQYGEGLHVLYPARAPTTNALGETVPGLTAGGMALNQLYAGLVTMAFALVGGCITGVILRLIGEWQAVDEIYRPGSTVVKLVLNVGNIMGGMHTTHQAMPKEAYFDDNLFFEVHDDDKVLVVTNHAGLSGTMNQGKYQMDQPPPPSTTTSTFTINEKPI